MKLPRAWTQPSPPASSRRLLWIASSLALSVLPPQGAAAEEKASGEFTVKVFRLWGAQDKSDRIPPKLKRYSRHLKKSSRRNAFALADKVITRKLRSGQELKVQLPQGYKGIWRLEVGPKGARLVQRLVNPKKKESVVRIKKSPGISTLARIRGELPPPGNAASRAGKAAGTKLPGVLVLLVEFGPAKAETEKKTDK